VEIRRGQERFVIIFIIRNKLCIHLTKYSPTKLKLFNGAIPYYLISFRSCENIIIKSKVFETCQ